MQASSATQKGPPSTVSCCMAEQTLAFPMQVLVFHSQTAKGLHEKLGSISVVKAQLNGSWSPQKSQTTAAGNDGLKRGGRISDAVS